MPNTQIVFFSYARENLNPYLLDFFKHLSAEIAAQTPWEPEDERISFRDKANLRLGEKWKSHIEGALQSQDYARLRVGVGPLPGGEPWEEFVLSPFAAAEREEIEALLPKLVEAVETWVREGVKH